MSFIGPSQRMAYSPSAYPMQDMEIQNGAKLTVRESQMAAFVNEGRMADVLGPACTRSTPTHCRC